MFNISKDYYLSFVYLLNFEIEKTTSTDSDALAVLNYLSYFVFLLDEINSVCGVTRFRCVASNKCIYNRYMCDGVADCPDDASDESEELCSGECSSGVVFQYHPLTWNSLPRSSSVFCHLDGCLLLWRKGADCGIVCVSLYGCVFFCLYILCLLYADKMCFTV